MCSSRGPGEVDTGCLTSEHTGPHAHGRQLGAPSAVPAEGADWVADANEAMQTDGRQEKNGACRHRCGVKHTLGMGVSYSIIG